MNVSNSLDQFTDLSLAYSMWQGPQPGVLFNSSGWLMCT